MVFGAVFPSFYSKSYHRGHFPKSQYICDGVLPQKPRISPKAPPSVIYFYAVVLPPFRKPRLYAAFYKYLLSPNLTPKKVLCQRAAPSILFRGKPSILSYSSLCPLFSCVCVRSSHNIFSQILFFNPIFLRPHHCWEQHKGRIDYIVINGYHYGKPHYIKVFA